MNNVNSYNYNNKLHKKINKNKINFFFFIYMFNIVFIQFLDL